jgi:hypothetical protein
MHRQVDTRFSQLAFCYLEGKLSPAELLELEEKLLDPAKQQLFVEMCMARRGIIELSKTRAQSREEVTGLNGSLSISAAEYERQLAQSDKKPVPDVALSDTMILPAIQMTSSSLDPAEEAHDPPISWSAAPVAPPGNLRAKWLRAAAVISPLLLLSGWWIVHPKHHTESIASIPSQDHPQLVDPSPAPKAIPLVATVKLSLQAKWDHGNSVDALVGLLPGPHTLDQGIVELELNGGAQIVLQAPVKFEVMSDNKVELTSGRISANVPHPSKGLTVHSPDLQIVDLGTEFGMDVIPEKKTHVEVFTGQVRAEIATAQGNETTRPSTGSTSDLITDATTSQILSKGEAVAVKMGTTSIEKDTTEPLGFVRSEELAARVAEAGHSSIAIWRAFSDMIRRDPDLLAYYTFENQPATSNRLTNCSIATMGKHNGTLGLTGKIDSSPEWSQGRWPGKGALKFGDHSGTAVIIDGGRDLIPTSNYSAVFWIKRSEPVFPVHLINQAANTEGSFNIGFTGTAGKVSPALLPNTIYFNYGRDSEISMPRLLPTDDQWLFIAITVDPTRMTRFYVNGKLAMQSPIKIFDGLDRTGNLCIGRVSPGNRRASAEDVFRGWMDELAFFHRTLSPREIERMYSTGNP